MRVKTNSDLQREYRHINESYFGGKLPNVPVKFGIPRGGRTVLASSEFKWGTHEPVRILISRGLGSRTTVISLIHEMVHVELFRKGLYRFRCNMPVNNPNKHPWGLEIRRLAMMGLFDWLI